MKRTAAVSALLGRRALHDRCVDRHQPLKKLDPKLNPVEHRRLRFWQLGGEPLGTTLNKFSEGLRLSAPRRGGRHQPVVDRRISRLQPNNDVTARGCSHAINSRPGWMWTLSVTTAP
jgi:hypothetical protein